MRALFAGLFVFACMLGTVGAISSRYPGGDHWPWWSTPAVVGAMFGSLFLSLFIFNSPGFRPNLTRKSIAEQIADLDRSGLLTRQSFRALRAFSIEEFEDEGSTYFIELDNGNTLVLTGQYLYDYDEIVDDEEGNQLRRFPCTEFEVLRHKQAGYVMDINCGGAVLEPEVIARAYKKSEWRRGVPEDGEIISGNNYEAIKRERTAL